jgi:hypothetical protein
LLAPIITRKHFHKVLVFELNHVSSNTDKPIFGSVITSEVSITLFAGTFGNPDPITIAVGATTIASQGVLAWSNLLFS